MNGFFAGIGLRDITPGSNLALWGYSDRQGPATGVLDPLMVYALVFRAGDTTAALVSADLGRPPMHDVMQVIRAQAADHGIAHVFFTTTHTHHAPEMDVPNAPYANTVLKATVEAIAEALNNLEPARIGLGSTTFDIAHNRRRRLKDGRCAMFWRNEERLPTAPLDPEATLIKFDTPDNKPIAMLVHFACHPVVMGPSNRQYSADYIGELRRVVQAQSGYPCVFLQGGCGDVNPYLDKTPIDEGGVEAARQVGGKCARAVLATLPGIDTHAASKSAVQFRRQEVSVGTRWNLDDPEERRIVFKAHGGEDGLFGRYLDAAKGDLAVPVTVLCLNDKVAFVGMPGEVFVQYQLELKTKAPVQPTLLCGYTDEYHAYFPTVADALAGGYGGTTASYVGLGAADKLAIEAQMLLAKIINGGKDTRTEEEFTLIDWREASH
ncbi:MAG: neutral/alkaline non-lysosomal ceramidase N-terminal domain-containing protein [Candidatus Hydrogenedentota bacterium]